MSEETFIKWSTRIIIGVSWVLAWPLLMYYFYLLNCLGQWLFE